MIGFLTGLGLLKLQHLIYPRQLTMFGMLFLVTNLSLMVFIQIFGLISYFLSNGWLQVVLDGKFSQKYPFNAGDTEGLILKVLFFLYYTFLITFLILLSMLMILLFTVSMIRHLISGSNQNWLLNLNLIYKTLWAVAGSGLLISVLEKLNWFHLTGLITLVLLM